MEWSGNNARATAKTMPITTADIEVGIPEAYRRYFLVSSTTLEETYRPTVEAFWEAIRVFSPAARFSRPAQVVIAASPFRIQLASGMLSYEPRPDVINAAVEHFIFLDVVKMARLAYPLQVTCIVEEFVHALMCVSNEDLTSIIVAQLYSGVSLVNGQYTIASAEGE